MQTGTRRARRDGAGSLCDACLHTASCSFLGSQAQPVRECVRFGPADFPREGRVGATTGRHALAGRLLGGRPTGGAASLCPGCSNAPGCRLAPGSGGVWYCGEYA